MSSLLLPPGVKRARGRDRWPLDDTLAIGGGARLRHLGEYVDIGRGTAAKVYRGPHDLTVLASMDDRGEPWGELLHASLSLPRGYPEWDLIYAVARAVFGTDVDCMMPIPREEAYIHGVAADQVRRAPVHRRIRQVFHLVEMPQAWPAEVPF